MIQLLLACFAICLPGAADSDPFAMPSAPLPFGGGWVENRGQWSDGVQAAADVGGAPLALVDGGLQWVLRGSAESLSVRLRVADLLPGEASLWELTAPLPGVHNYLIGDLRATGLEAFSEARLRTPFGALTVHSGVHPGWSVRTPGGAEQRFLVEGARAVGVGPRGGVLLRAGAETWRVPAPTSAGAPGGRWVVHSESEVGLWPLDPAVALEANGDDSSSVDWGTYLGTLSFFDEEGRGSDYDSEGRPVTCGLTPSAFFPTVVGPFLQAPGGATDGFVTQFTSDGAELVFSTYVGGARKDYFVGLDVASNDEIGLLALTRSPNWPLTPNAYDSVLEPPGQEYGGAVMRLSADGQTIRFSTFYGTRIGDIFPRKFALARDDGSVVVAGDFAIDVPITPESAFGQAQNLTFLAGLSADGSELLFSTSPPCQPFLTQRSDGALVVGGDSNFLNAGLPGSFQESVGSGSGLNAWVGIVSADGAELLAASYLFGNGLDSGRGVAVDWVGNVYVAGTTNSPDFPRGVGTLGVTPGPLTPAYIAKFDPGLENLLWSTTVGVPSPGGGAPQTAFEGLVCDASGVTTGIGWGSLGPAFESPGSHEYDYPQGTQDGRVFRLSPDGQRVLYSSMFGIIEPGYSGIRVPALAPNRRTALFSGTTNGSADVLGDFPGTTGAFQGSCSNFCGDQAYLVQFSFFHEGIAALGEGGESCLGTISLNTTRRADPGADDFAFYASQAPPSTLGVLLLGQPLPLPLSVEGQTLWIDLGTLLPLQTLATQETGFAALDLMIPPNAAGLSFAAQAVFASTATCGRFGELVASEGILVSVP